MRSFISGETFQLEGERERENNKKEITLYVRSAIHRSRLNRLALFTLKQRNKYYYIIVLRVE